MFETIKEELKTVKQESDSKENYIEDSQIYNYVCDDYDLESDDSTDFENDAEVES